MDKRKILVQIDPDRHASLFDAVTAIDAGADQLLQYSNVGSTDVRELVHGAMFTRGPRDLHRTAVFIGGPNVAAGEALLKAVTQCFFGPMRVSVMLDANGANTTAAAAVLAAAEHVGLAGGVATVLAATGPVGQRIVRLLAREGCRVRVGSRSLERARDVCDQIRQAKADALLEPVGTSSPQETASAVQGVQILLAAGAAGVELVPPDVIRTCGELQVAIDLNAVPPLGIGGIEASDKAEMRHGICCYGAIGVGGTKMKIHKAAVARLFEANDQVLDAEEIYLIGRQLQRSD